MDEVCSLCNGSGWIITERDGISGAERCDCVARTRARNLIESAGIPTNYGNASIDNFILPQDNPIARKALGAVMGHVRTFTRDFPHPDKPGLMFIGDTGTGKTHLAVAALRELIARGFEGLFFDFQNLLDRIRSGYSEISGSSEREAYNSALEAEILMLDDLGAHRITDWVQDTVTSIITYRCNNRKPLIITTNVPDPDVTGNQVDSLGPGGTPIYKRTLAEAIGMRARSRLFEMCRVIRMPNIEDHRIRTKKTLVTG